VVRSAWELGVPCVRSGLSSRPRLPCSTYGRFSRGRFFVGWPSQINSQHDGYRFGKLSQAAVAAIRHNRDHYVMV
jgi:hypothetical protein